MIHDKPVNSAIKRSNKNNKKDIPSGDEKII
jgi:hypothetical protein